MKLLQTISITAAMILAVVQARSQEISDADSSAEFYMQQFRGWPGISFKCQPVKEVAWQKTLCDLVVQEVALLAAQSNIQISSCIDCDTFESVVKSRRSGLKHPIDLIVEFRTTNDGVGGIVLVQVESLYSNAIESNAEIASPEVAPRPGTLEFWTKWVAFSGSAVKSTELAPYVTGLIKEFFAIYISANR
jgi:hypothetical protein